MKERDHVVTASMLPNDLIIGKATRDHVAEISEILCEAAVWMARHRRPLWDADRLGQNFVYQVVAREEFIAAWCKSRIVGVMILQWHDLEFWPDYNDGTAAYLHKIAVRRSDAGQGVPARMVRWASDHARRNGRTLLRLDCDLHPSLCAVYERLGFARVDIFRAKPPDRAPFSVARYQMAT